jgi:hypothetical protein
LTKTMCPSIPTISKPSYRNVSAVSLTRKDPQKPLFPRLHSLSAS